MSKTFFTSDTHFWHARVLTLCKNRQAFASNIEELNEAMIDIWNSQVSDLDHVYHLGDFSFGNTQRTEHVLSRLNGILHLVKGNHDHWADNGYLRSYWNTIEHYRMFKQKDIRIALFHYPITEWDKMHYGSMHLFGHVHGNYQGPGRSMDVGVDARPNNDMRLWELDEVVETLKDREILPHHGD